MTLAIVLGIAAAASFFMGGFLIGRYTRDPRKTIEACAVANRCIVRQISETKEWTGELSRQLQAKLDDRASRLPKR